MPLNLGGFILKNMKDQVNNSNYMFVSNDCYCNLHVVSYKIKMA